MDVAHEPSFAPICSRLFLECPLVVRHLYPALAAAVSVQWIFKGILPRPLPPPPPAVFNTSEATPCYSASVY